LRYQNLILRFELSKTIIMQEDNSFLPLFLQEEIYVINEGQPNFQEQKEAAPTQAAPEVSMPEYFGQNRSQVLIVADSFEEAEKNFLSKILQAVKLSFEDVAVVESAKLAEFSQLKSIESRVLISFGVQQEKFLHNFPAYSIQKKAGKQIMLADSLSVLVNDTKKKALLWANLQKVFL
jgi:DNA polymerase III psi subunit